MSQIKNISILGCGWLGVPLAVRLIELDYSVKGSFREAAKEPHLVQNNIHAYEINITTEDVLGDSDNFFDVDYLIISLPPGRTNDNLLNYPKLILSVIEKCNHSKIKGVVFLSSTSVYPANGARMVESSDYVPDKPVGYAIQNAEEQLKKNLKAPLTILRLAGLIGADRMPQNYLKNKKSIKMGSGPTNLIHQKDCIRVVEKILNENIWTETINVCCDEHPSREKFYQAAAEKYKFKLPVFENNNQNHFKIVDNQKLKQLLGNDILLVSNPLDLF